MLTHLRDRLYGQQTFEGAVTQILADAIALHGAEFGDVQLPAKDNLLVIVEQLGFKSPFLDTFRGVCSTDGSACGRALRTGRPVVIPDVDVDAEYAPIRKVAREAGYRAVVTTPLVTSTGVLIGFVSVHFVNVHTPTPIEMDTLMSYSRLAADYLQELLRSESLHRKAQEMSERLYERDGLMAARMSSANEEGSYTVHQ